MTRLFGRSPESARMRAAVDQMHDRPHAVVLLGDAGVGKSRLLAETVAEAGSAGALVLRGACLDVGDAWPYHPIQESLDRLGAEDGPGAGRARELLSIFEVDQGTEVRGRVLERLHRGLTELASDRPLVLVLDDLQWVDSSTRRLVLTLLSGLATVRLLLVGAVRTEDVPAGSPLLALLHRLARSGRAELLEVGPLDRVQTDELARDLSTAPLTPLSIETIWRRSGGNPLLVEELTRSGPLESLPTTLRQSVLLRVGVLSAPLQELVRSLCVAVGPVAYDVLVRVLARTDAEVIFAARGAVAAGLVVADEDGYALRHALLREALEGDLLPDERRALHRRFAEALVAGGSSRYGQLGHHWLGAGDVQRALVATVTAAEQAERLRSASEACHHWQQAADLAVASAEPADLEGFLRRAAEAAHHSGEHDRAVELVDRAGALAPATDRAGAPPLGALRARYLVGAGRLRAAVAEFEQVLASATTGRSQRAEMAARLAEVLVRLGDYEGAGERARTALERPVPGGCALATAVLASSALGRSQAHLGDPLGLSTLEHAAHIAEASDDPEVVAAAHLHLAELLMGPLNELEQGVAWALRGAELVAAAAYTTSHATPLLAAASNGLFRLGRWGEAEELTSRALRLDPTGDSAADLLLARARTRMGSGDLTRAGQDLDAATVLSAADESRCQVLPLATLRAGLALWHHDAEAAAAAVHWGWEAAGQDCDDDWLLAPLVWHGLRAAAEAAGRGTAGDRATVTWLSGAADRLGSASHDGSGARREVLRGYQLLCSAELSRTAAGSDPTAWAAAAALWSGISHPYPAAYAQFRQAEALLHQRTRSREAAEVLDSARSAARRLGAQPLLTEIDALACRARIRLRGEEVPAPAPVHEHRAVDDPMRALTSREREVLSEVAAGRTNREIGQRLFITERTVGVHVSRVLAKIRARSRVEATGIYLRHHPQGPTVQEPPA